MLGPVIGIQFAAILACGGLFAAAALRSRTVFAAADPARRINRLQTLHTVAHLTALACGAVAGVHLAMAVAGYWPEWTEPGARAALAAGLALPAAAAVAAILATQCWLQRRYVAGLAADAGHALPGLLDMLGRLLANWAWLGAIALVCWGSAVVFGTLHPFFAAVTLGVFIVNVGAGLQLRHTRGGRPVASGRLHELFTELQQRSGIRGGRLWLADTPQAPGAYVAGLLPPWRRIVISRTVSERLDPAQIRALLAHELGHVARWHLAKLLGLTLAWVGLCWGVAHAGYPTLASAAYVPYWVFLVSYASRRMEHDADCYAARLTSREDVVSALRAVAAVSYLPEDLPREHELFEDYPSINSRIRHLRNVCQG